MPHSTALTLPGHFSHWVSAPVTLSQIYKSFYVASWQLRCGQADGLRQTKEVTNP